MYYRVAKNSAPATREMVGRQTTKVQEHGSRYDNTSIKICFTCLQHQGHAPIHGSNFQCREPNTKTSPLCPNEDVNRRGVAYSNCKRRAPT
jgi:hypothetical protein